MFADGTLSAKRYLSLVEQNGLGFVLSLTKWSVGKPTQEELPISSSPGDGQ